MHIVAVGRLRGCPEAELFDRYNSRLRPKITVTEVPEAKGSPAEIKRREAASLLGALPKGAVGIALDLGGPPIGSEAFSMAVRNWSEMSKPVAFIIGGAEGLDQLVLDRADYRLSLGLLTWPHFLVRAMLAEQVYRAQSILAGHPYHRAGRPGAG
jgi:23S rRNA (pseudouridine1915-N3)-methyltransferase